MDQRTPTYFVLLMRCQGVPWSPHTTLEGPMEYIRECKMDVNSTRIPTWHPMDLVSWLFGLLSKNCLLEVGLTQNRETMALRILATVLYSILSCMRTRMNRNLLK